MGTNYYLHAHGENHCEYCGRQDEGQVWHIGKSSFGWRFSLHVFDDIRTLDDWISKMSEILGQGGYIKDEYGHHLDIEHMLRIIKDRPVGSRRDTSGYCVGYGEGEWDYIQGDFS